jgi:hypothetical protein
MARGSQFVGNVDNRYTASSSIGQRQSRTELSMTTAKRRYRRYCKLALRFPIMIALVSLLV